MKYLIFVLTYIETDIIDNILFIYLQIIINISYYINNERVYIRM